MQTIGKKRYPKFKYKVEEDEESAIITLSLNKKYLEQVILWSAESDDKDFRPKTFVAKELNISHCAKAEVKVNFPKQGYKAFLIMAKYKHPNGGEPYNITTRMFTADSKELFDEVYIP